MNSPFPKWQLWRMIALLGATLVAFGAIAGYVDVGTHFKFDFIDDYYEVVAVGILIGVAFVFIGCIGVAQYCATQQRVLMAALVFIAPWAALFVGSPIGGTNIHGPAAIIMMLIAPATFLAVVLLFMAAFGSEKTR